MKFVSDFDGVLTDLSQEADRVKEIFTLGISRSAGLGDSATSHFLELAESAMRKTPHQFGWYSNGRISAYCNEDGFIRVNALGALLDGWASAPSHFSEAAEIRLRLTKTGTATFTDLAQASYHQMVKETASGARHPLDPKTRPVIETLLGRGHQVVVVSNSGTDRILQMLRAVGLAAETAPGSALRVRGDAQKFVLGNKARTFSVGAYEVDVDRPGYEKILREEKPDVVIGDVFSLDLALPTHLSKEKEFSGLRPILRKRPYTPEWSLSHLSLIKGKEDKSGVIDSLDGLVELDQ